VKRGYPKCNEISFKPISVDDVLDDEQPSRVDVRKGKFVPKYMDENGVANGFVMVGHGVLTSPSTCGKWRGSKKGCLNVQGHSHIGLDGVDYSGKVFWKKVRYSCYKPSCPVCYDGGWAFRDAGKIEARMKEGSKHFGLAEHIVVSVPVKDYGLSFKALRRKAIKVAKKRGVVGGSIIPHGFRYRKYACVKKGVYYSKGWYFSPHFHFVAFVFGGYSKCRNCPRKSNCDSGCDGFDSRAWKLFNEDGWLVKILSKRKSVWGTAFYQLTHSTYEVVGKRDVVVSWFGSCSYHKLKVTVEMRREFCPLCQCELGDIQYVGLNRDQFFGEKKGFADLVEDGVVVWETVTRRKGIAGAKGNRITEGDYFHFPSRSEFACKRRFESAKAVWNGGLPKMQYC